MLFSEILNNPVLGLLILLAIIIVIGLHEFSHALAGFLLGDHTAEDEGRLTLNPFAHLDPVGTLMIVFAGFGWGKPVPYNPYNLRNQKWGPALIGLAGPASNFISALFFAAILKLALPSSSLDNYLIQFLLYLVYISVGLGFFNLLPIPPLDGSKFLFAIIPSRYENVIYWLQKNGIIFLIGLVLILNVANVPLFDWIINFLISGIFSIVGL